jgi:hypothetical protein
MGGCELGHFDHGRLRARPHFDHAALPDGLVAAIPLAKPSWYVPGPGPL